MFETFFNNTHSVNRECLVQIAQIPVLRKMLTSEIAELKDELVWVTPDAETGDAAIQFTIKCAKIQAKIQGYSDLLSFLETVQADAAAKQMEN